MAGPLAGMFGYYRTLMASIPISGAFQGACPAAAAPAGDHRRRPEPAAKMPLTRAIVVLLVSIACTSCAIIYRLPTRQGNVIEQRELDRLKLGMTKDQVQYILGTPIAADPFRTGRWDYYGYYKSPRGQVSERNVALFFGADDKLERMEGQQLASNNVNLGTPDAEAMQKQKAKERLEDSRLTRDSPAKPPPAP
jgi:outer membrane protein assembly factor BamE